MRDLVAQLGGLFELQGLRRALHVVGQSHQQLPRFALQEHLGPLDLLRVVLLADQTHAGAGAAVDLVLQAGPGTIAEIAVLALPDLEYALQEMQRLAHRTGARVRTEVAAAGALAPAVQRQAGKPVAAGQVDVRIRLVVAQQDIERRLVRLDEVLLQQQRVGLGGGDGDLHVTDAHHQRLGLGIQPRVAKVAAEAIAQVPRLAHVEQFAGSIVHLVHAAAIGHRGEKGGRVEFVTHRPAPPVRFPARSRSARRPPA